MEQHFAGLNEFLDNPPMLGNLELPITQAPRDPMPYSSFHGDLHTSVTHPHTDKVKFKFLMNKY